MIPLLLALAVPAFAQDPPAPPVPPAPLAQADAPPPPDAPDQVAPPQAPDPVVPPEAPLAADPPAPPDPEGVAALREEIARLRADLERMRSDRGTRDTGAPAGDLESAITFGGEPNVVQEGQTVDEAVGFGTDVIVAGHVRGDATSFGGDVHVKDGGSIDGDAVSFGGRVVVDDGGLIRGSRVSTGERAGGKRGHNGIGNLFSGLYDKLVFLLSFAGAGVLLVGLFPHRVGSVARTLETRPLASAVLGVVVVPVVAIASLLFAITVIGIPVSFLLVATTGLAWLLGFVGLCQTIGDRLPFEQKTHGRWLAFLAGTLIVGFLGSLPFVGFLAVLGASVLGIGAALLSRFGR